MLFHSFDFLVFFLLVAAVYFLLPVRLRWVWILLNSYIFYAYWNPWYVLLLIFSTLTDFFAAQQMAKLPEKVDRKKWLYLSLTLNLGLLGVFKYFDFFAEQFAWLAKIADPTYEPVYLHVLLPIGISFYTFQTLGYSIDVYRGKQKAINHLGIFAVYVAFFPQLVAGPIERAKDLLPQLHFDYSFDLDRITEGMRLFLWGAFKKMVIADRIALYTTLVLGSPDAYGGMVIWIAMMLFFLQLYFDFSAYQDMAVGVAHILGVRLSKNFVPFLYFSRSFTEGWTRWHITLTNWIKDYVFLPLSRWRKEGWWLKFSYLVLFFLIGFWHGANWTYIIWGVLNGVILLIERSLRSTRKKIGSLLGPTLMSILSSLLFFQLSSFTLLFFRTGRVSETLTLMDRMFTVPDSRINPGMPPFEFNILWPLLAAVILLEYFRREVEPLHIISFDQAWQRWLAYVLIGNAILLLQIHTISDFIYFEF